LSWSASTGATSYNVKRATVSGGPYTTIAGSINNTTYSDNSVSYNTTYYYVVSAVNSAGQSTNSAQLSVTPTPPGPAPTGLNVSAGNDQVVLTWTGVQVSTAYNRQISKCCGLNF
jgi:cellulose 1,4-beta-cellobiosidase